MANEGQLAILRQSVEVWNQWREEHQEVEIDLAGAKLKETNLEGANLKKANLEGANFFRANLFRANLKEANLKEANLWETSFYAANLLGANLESAKLNGANLLGANLFRANLNGANLNGANLHIANLSEANLFRASIYGASIDRARLDGANLLEADLSEVNAVGSYFDGCNMTGICIKDWHINSKTSFVGIKCDYVYRTYDEEKTSFRGRLPVDPASIFKEGEFEEWIKISTEAQQTIDLTFTEGIDWQAFFQSLQGVREQYPESEVSLQAIEKKGSAFVIRLETALDADQSAIESTQKKLYNTQLALSKAEGKIEILQNMNQTLERLAGKGMDKPTYHTTNNAQNIGVQQSGSGTISHFKQKIGNNLDEIGDLIESLREAAQSFPAEQKNDALDELETIEAELVDPKKCEPTRLSRRLKRLFIAGTAAATFVGCAATGAVDLSKKANDFTGNVLKLANKLGIELVQAEHQESR